MDALRPFNPLPHWVRQLEQVVADQRSVLEARHGMTVILEIKPGGRIETPKLSIKYWTVDKHNIDM